MSPIDRWSTAPSAPTCAVASYHVADASGFIKLDAMENPYHLPHHLREDWRSAWPTWR
jgi:histidinol-phosphate aminotransferase